MLKTQVMERGSGKTTTIVKKMRNNPNSIVLIHHKGVQKIFNKEFPDLKDRTFNFDDLGIESKGSIKINELLLWLTKSPKCRVFIDEGFIGSPDDLANLYFALGQYNVNVESFGSIKKNNDDNNKSLFYQKIISSLHFKSDPDKIHELIIVDSQKEYFEAINYLNKIHTGNFDFKADGCFEGIYVSFDYHKYYITTLKKLDKDRRFSSVRFLNFKGDK